MTNYIVDEAVAARYDEPEIGPLERAETAGYIPTRDTPLTDADRAELAASPLGAALAASIAEVRALDGREW